MSYRYCTKLQYRIISINMRFWKKIDSRLMSKMLTQPHSTVEIKVETGIMHSIVPAEVHYLFKINYILWHKTQHIYRIFEEIKPFTKYFLKKHLLNHSRQNHMFTSLRFRMFRTVLYSSKRWLFNFRVKYSLGMSLKKIWKKSTRKHHKHVS